jgi:hypothetical protein
MRHGLNKVLNPKGDFYSNNQCSSSAGADE